MEDAVKVIKRKFKHMKGFELHKVYFVDDEFSESTLQAVNAKVRNRDGQKIYAGCLFSDRFSDTDKRVRY